MTTGSSYGPNTSSQMTADWVEPQYAYASQGNDSWYHVSLDVPQGSDCFTNGAPNTRTTANDCWFPTEGQWNVLTEWHDDGHTWDYGAQSPYMGVFTDYSAVNGVGNNPHLVLVLRGGTSRSPSEKDVELSAPLLYNHWYSITFHFVWSTSATTGLAEWWVDGTQEFSQHLATLYSNADGTVSYNSFGLYNYHLAAPWNDTADFANVAIGPSRGAVGG
jgi:hypothetical protein